MYILCGAYKYALIFYPLSGKYSGQGERVRGRGRGRGQRVKTVQVYYIINAHALTLRIQRDRSSCRVVSCFQLGVFLFFSGGPGQTVCTRVSSLPHSVLLLMIVIIIIIVIMIIVIIIIIIIIVLSSRAIYYGT